MAVISAAAGTTDGIVAVVTAVEPGMAAGTMGVAAIDAAAAGITVIPGTATTVAVRLLRSVIIAPAVIADKCLSS